MEDCCTVFCCPGCAIIQLHKQIDPKTNILGLQKWEDTIYTFTYPLVFLKNKSGTFEKKLLSTSLISMSCVHQVLLPVSVITHRSHKQRKQPSVCILLDRCIALWPTNSIRETSSLFTPGQLWRHSMEQRGLSNVVSLYTPARAVHSTLESSSVWWSCWHGLGESQRRVSPVQVQCNQRINNRPLNPTDPTDYRDSLRYEWSTPTSHELSSSIFQCCPSVIQLFRKWWHPIKSSHYDKL